MIALASDPPQGVYDRCDYEACQCVAVWRVKLMATSGPIDEVLCPSHAAELFHSWPSGVSFDRIDKTI